MIAAWWPRPEKPFQGLFIKEHVEAISTYFDVTLIHLKITKTQKFGFPKIKLLRLEENGIHLIFIDIYTPIRRFGVHDWLIRHAYSKTIRELTQQNKFIGYHLHVRTHITKLVPKLSVLKEFRFVHTEHFSFYHRGINVLPESKKLSETTEIKKWFKNNNLLRVLPVSKDLAYTLQTRFDCPIEKLKVIPNIASKDFSYKPVPTDDNKIWILLAGIWNGPKRPIQLFEAILKLDLSIKNRLKINIVGNGAELEKARSFQERNLPDLNVTYHGFQNKTFIAQLANKSHFLAHPTLAENSPTIISECLFTGLPILSMNVNGIPEMVDESNGILVEPNDIDSLSEALLSMIEKIDEFDREVISKAAFSKFSTESIGNQIKSELLRLELI